MHDPAKLKIGVAQTETIVEDLDAGFDKHHKMIEAARREDIEVLLFPELSLSGHGIGPNFLEMALPRDDPRILELARASGEMVTLFGLIEDGVAAQFYNSVVAVQDGKVIFVHRKINLATYGMLEEGKHFAAGRYVETFQLGTPEFTAYVAAKGGQNGFTRSLATELAPWNITVNMVSPGWIPVERHAKDPQAVKDAYLAGLPSGRWGTPEEVADTVAFLASEEASYVSGQNVCVNGAHTVA